MNFELENKVALVTGGSKNIGKEIALSLASEKVNIAFTYKMFYKRSTMILVISIF